MFREQNQLSPEIASSIELTIRHYKPDILLSSKQGFWIVNQLVGTFSREFQINPLQHMQNVISEEAIDIKFIAIPKGSELDRYGFATTTTGVTMPSDTNNYGIALPHDPKGNYPYYLHTIVDRIGEYHEDLTLLKVTPEENFNRLAQTGMLFLKSGSQEARITNSPNN